MLGGLVVMEIKDITTIITKITIAFKADRDTSITTLMKDHNLRLQADQRMSHQEDWTEDISNSEHIKNRDN